MFLIEYAAGAFARSMALQADALDFLGDTLTYGITLLAIGHALRWRAYAAIFKGTTLLLMGLWVLGSTLYRVAILGVPNELTMGSVAALALAANAASSAATALSRWGCQRAFSLAVQSQRCDRKCGCYYRCCGCPAAAIGLAGPAGCFPDGTAVFALGLFDHPPGTIRNARRFTCNEFTCSGGSDS